MANFIITILKGAGVILAGAAVLAIGVGLLYLCFLLLGFLLEAILVILPFIGIALAVAIPTVVILGVAWLLGKAVSKKRK